MPNSHAGCSAEDIALGSRSPIRTLADLAAKELVSYLISMVYLFVVPLMITSSQPPEEATAALAAISVSGPFEYLSFMFGWFFSIGGSAVIGNCIGAGDIEGAETLLAQMIVLGLICGALLTVILCPSLRSLLDILIDSEEGLDVISKAMAYIQPEMAGSVLIIMYFVFLSVFMGTGHMTIYLLLQLGEQVLNIGILCPVLLFKTNLGVLGSSLAIILSYVPFLIISIVLVYKKSPIRVRLSLLWKNKTWRYLKKCCGIGIIDLISSASGMVVLGTVQVIINQIALRFSNELYEGSSDIYKQVLAAWGCLSRIYNIVTGVCYNITGSYLTAASYALGAKRPARFYQLSIVIILLDCSITLVFCAIVAGIADYLAIIFSGIEFYVILSRDITRIFCITGGLLPLEFLSTTYCEAANLIWKGVVVALVTEILLIPIIFVTIFYSTRILDPRANFYLSIASFNINDIISAVISVALIFVELRRFCRKNGIHSSVKLAFSKDDGIEGIEEHEATSELAVA